MSIYVEHLPCIRAGEINLGLFKQLFFLGVGTGLFFLYTPEFSSQLEGPYPKVKLVLTFLEASGLGTLASPEHDAGKDLYACQLPAALQCREKDEAKDSGGVSKIKSD